MACAGHHLEPVAADRERVLGDDAPERPRRRRDHAKILQPVAEQDLGRLLAQAVRTVEAAIGLGPEALRVEPDAERHHVFRVAHRQLQIEALAEPAGEADMVGMEMGGDDAGQPAAGERSGNERLPGGARGRVVDAGVDEREPGAVLDQVDVDVVEPERQRQPRP